MDTDIQSITGKSLLSELEFGKNNGAHLYPVINCHHNAVKQTIPKLGSLKQPCASSPESTGKLGGSSGLRTACWSWVGSLVSVVS